MAVRASEELIWLFCLDNGTIMPFIVSTTRFNTDESMTPAVQTALNADCRMFDGQSLQDMDISPDRSSPLSDHTYAARDPNAAALVPYQANAVPPVVAFDNSHHTTGSLLAAALPRIATPATGPRNDGGATPACVDGGETPTRDAGPPTPTHSEKTDSPPLHLEQQLPGKMECLDGYSSEEGGALHHAARDLTAHVTGWPADILEKQADKCAEEAYQLRCQHTQVSAELVCSRALVRHAEIQVASQARRRMHLWQQIRALRISSRRTRSYPTIRNTGGARAGAPASTPEPRGLQRSLPAEHSHPKSKYCSFRPFSM